MDGHCLQAMRIVHHHANGRFDWLISGHPSVNPLREATSIMSGKYKRFTFVHPVAETREMIYESLNLKGVVTEPKQISFGLQSITTCTGFETVCPIFYKVHSLSSEQVFN